MDIQNILKQDFSTRTILAVTTGGHWYMAEGADDKAKYHACIDLVAYASGNPEIGDVELAMLLPSARETILKQYPQLEPLVYVNEAEGDLTASIAQAADWAAPHIAMFGDILSLSPTDVPVRLTIDEIVEFMVAINPDIECLDIGGIRPDMPIKKSGLKPSGKDM